MSKFAKTATVMALGILLLAPAGCFNTPEPEPSPLFGSWELSGALVDPDISDYVIQFDENGEIVEISYRFQDSARIIINGSAIESSSNVEDDNVSIVAEWFNINSLFFEGVFNADQTVISGSVSYEVNIGAVTIEVPVGDAELTLLE